MKNAREKTLQIINDVLYKGAFLEESLEILKKSNIEERDYNFIKEKIEYGDIEKNSYFKMYEKEFAKQTFVKNKVKQKGFKNLSDTEKKQ